MIIVKSEFSVSATKWESVESIVFETSETPNCRLKIVTTSGRAITALNPTNEHGEPIDLEMAMTVWSYHHPNWTINDNDSKVKNPTLEILKERL